MPGPDAVAVAVGAEREGRGHFVGGRERVAAAPGDFGAAADQAGQQIAAPKTYGSRKYKVLESAPGSYVKAKA